MRNTAIKINENLQHRFATRAFYMQHIAPYDYVKRFSGDKVVLDAGTASGYGAFYLAEVAKSVVGIDIDSVQIEKAQNCYNRSNLKYAVSDILDIQYPDKYFDVVISSQVVEHIALDKMDKYLSEIYRVLKKDGIFFVVTVNLLNNLKGRSSKEYDKCTQHIKEFIPSELKDFLLSRFPSVTVLGSGRSSRHNFYYQCKKSGMFRILPDKFNPVKRFYNDRINVSDFVYSSGNLDRSLDLLGICRKV